jgi:hypothetical protein
VRFGLLRAPHALAFELRRVIRRDLRAACALAARA